MWKGTRRETGLFVGVVLAGREVRSYASLNDIENTRYSKKNPNRETRMTREWLVQFLESRFLPCRIFWVYREGRVVFRRARTTPIQREGWETEAKAYMEVRAPSKRRPRVYNRPPRRYWEGVGGLRREKQAPLREGTAREVLLMGAKESRVGQPGAVRWSTGEARAVSSVPSWEGSRVLLANTGSGAGEGLFNQ